MEVQNKISKVSEQKVCDHRNIEIMSPAYVKKKRSHLSFVLTYIGFAQSNKHIHPYVALNT